MAKDYLKDILLLVGKHNLSSLINKINLNSEVAKEDSTTLDSIGWREFTPTMKEGKWSYGGYWAADGTNSDPDSTLFAALGTASPATAIKPAVLGTPAVGDIAYFMNGCSGKHEFGGSVGELAKMSLELWGTSPTLRGKLLDRQAAATATGNGTAQQHTAVSATQRLYYAVHVVGGTAGTLDLVIESDNAGGFGSAATVVALPQFTGPGSVFGYVSGPITDDYFRIARTIAGGGTWNYYVCLAVSSF